MNQLRLALLCSTLLIPVLASAELTPERGSVDPRVRIVNYNPADVVRLVTFYGVSTHVQFGAGEVIKDVAVGDEQAWAVVSRGNNLYVKPKAEQADTNLTIATDKHVYQFALTVERRSQKDQKAWTDPNLIFSLSFRYPEEEAARRATATAAAAAAERVAERNAEVRARLEDAKAVVVNEDYWAAGSPEITPTGARDDGRFIYLTFSNNRDMPSVFSLGEDDKEALINTSVEGNTIVVQRLVRRLMLRKGSSVVSVVNKSFDLDAGSDNATGTVAPNVQRIVRGQP